MGDRATPETVIARVPPNDGRDWENQCARCGSSVERVDCWQCNGEGETLPGELYEQDPLWHDEDDVDPCGACLGCGGFWRCLSSPEWCETHPNEGRESVERGAIEWFTLDVRRTHG